MFKIKIRGKETGGSSSVEFKPPGEKSNVQKEKIKFGSAEKEVKEEIKTTSLKGFDSEGRAIEEKTEESAESADQILIIPCRHKLEPVRRQTENENKKINVLSGPLVKSRLRKSRGLVFEPKNMSYIDPKTLSDESLGPQQSKTKKFNKNKPDHESGLPENEMENEATRKGPGIPLLARNIELFELRKKLKNDPRELLRAEIEQLPDAPSMRDYINIPVDDIGLAILRGMGYDPDDESQKVKEYSLEKRVYERAGLGADEFVMLPGEKEAHDKKRKEKEKKESLEIDKSPVKNGPHSEMLMHCPTFLR